MDTREALDKKLKTLEDNIQELKARLPAHSEKPGMMMELMDLEDELDSVLAKINFLNKSAET